MSQIRWFIESKDDHNIMRVITRDKDEYGKVNLHSLRHTYATRLIESGIPAHVVQKELGHSDISITMNIYCSVFDKFRKEHLATARDYMVKNNLSMRCHIGCQAP